MIAELITKRLEAHARRQDVIAGPRKHAGCRRPEPDSHERCSVVLASPGRAGSRSGESCDRKQAHLEVKLASAIDVHVHVEAARA